MISSASNADNLHTNKEYLITLMRLEQIILNLDNNNVQETVQSVINLFDNKYSYSYKYIVCRLVYSSFVSRRKDSNICFDFLKLINQKYENSNKNEIFNLFSKSIFSKNTQESYYLLAQMAENNLIDPEIIKYKLLHFAHYMEEDRNRYQYYNFHNEFIQNYDELSKDDWKLHKKLLKEGVNPNTLLKIIRNDEIEKLQEISSQPNFDFNQRIEPSLYERCSLINNNYVTLIDYAAFFSAIKCFKFLLMNGSVLVTKTSLYAIAGGNIEIIHLCEQNHLPFRNAYKIAIEYHQNDIFKYLYENSYIESKELNDSVEKCVLYDSYEILSYLEEKEVKIFDSIIYTTAENGNLLLIKHFLKTNQYPKNILIATTYSGNIELVKYFISKKGFDVNACNNLYFDIFMFYNNIWNFFKVFQTALMIASLNGKVQAVKLLLEQEGIDVNIKAIYLY